MIHYMSLYNITSYSMHFINRVLIYNLNVNFLTLNYIINYTNNWFKTLTVKCTIGMLLKKINRIKINIH